MKLDEVKWKPSGNWLVARSFQHIETEHVYVLYKPIRQSNDFLGCPYGVLNYTTKQHIGYDELEFMCLLQLLVPCK